MAHEDIERALAQMSENARLRFFADLCFYLGHAARDAYANDSATAAVEGRNQLRAYNEMVIVVATELTAVLDPSVSSRSHSDFLRTLEEWAHHGNCGEGLAWALSKALAGNP